MLDHACRRRSPASIGGSAVVLLFASYEPTEDPRVWRCARALAERGVPVTVVAQLESDCVEDEESEGVSIRRVAVGGISRPLRARFGHATRAIRTSGDATTSASSTSLGEVGLLGGVASASFGVARMLHRTRALLDASRDLHPKIVHAHDEVTWLAGALAARRTRAPLVLDAHELPAEDRDDWGPLARSIQAAWLTPLLRNAHALITVNPTIADKIADRFRVKRPDVIWNCPPLSPPPVEDPPADGPLRILYHGLFDFSRGIEALIEGAARVPGVELRLRGSGRAEPSLRDVARRVGFNPDEVFLPRIPMPELVRQASGFHVGAVPYPPVSRNNALASPNKLFEYFMAGLCVAATDLPVLRALVAESRAGIVVSPDADGWQRGLAMLAEDRQLVIDAGRRARVAAATRWSWEHQVDTLLGLYRRVAPAVLAVDN